MSILHFKFKPRIALWHDSHDNEKTSYPTINEEFNQIALKAIVNDRINFKNAYRFVSGDELTFRRYVYTPEDNLIEVLFDVNHGLPSKELIKEMIDIYTELGPDTWMEADIDLVDKEVAARFGYYAIELQPELESVWIAYPSGDGYRENRVIVEGL